MASFSIYSEQVGLNSEQKLDHLNFDIYFTGRYFGHSMRKSNYWTHANTSMNTVMKEGSATCISMVEKVLWF